MYMYMSTILLYLHPLLVEAVGQYWFGKFPKVHLEAPSNRVRIMT